MMLTRALQALRPDQEFTITDNDLSTIVWNSSDVTTPTKSQVDKKIADLEAADAKAVADKESAKASAIAKLEALGLTLPEAQAILGQ
jgi:hypothetical protein